MDKTTIDFLSLIISIIAVIIASFSLVTARRQAQDAIWAVRFNAYRSLEIEGDIDAYLEIHGITSDELQKHGLTKETIRSYLLFTNALWSSALRMKGYRRIRRIKDYTEKVEMARKYTWAENTMSGRIIRSEKFDQAWPIIQRFWDTGDEAVTSPLIEAGVLEGREQRASDNK